MVCLIKTTGKKTWKVSALAIVLLAGVVAGELYAADDLETLDWVPLSGPQPEMAFEADECIIKRYQKTKVKERLPVDPDVACNGIL